MKNLFKSKKIIGLITILLIISCTNSLKIKVDDENALKHVNKICEKLDTAQCNKFKTRFENILILSELGKEAKVMIIQSYGTKYENLTLEDILNKALKEKEE